MSDYDDTDEGELTATDTPCCDMCSSTELTLVVGMEGLPWAYNICGKKECFTLASNKLQNIANIDMEGESDDRTR